MGGGVEKKWIHSIRVTNGSFDSCNSLKRLGTSRLHDLFWSSQVFFGQQVCKKRRIALEEPR